MNPKLMKPADMAELPMGRIKNFLFWHGFLSSMEILQDTPGQKVCVFKPSQ
jgi:hypothetical protein